MLLSIKSKKRGASLKVGEYESTVKDIGFHPEYVEGAALLVRYELKDERENCYNFSETFLNSERNLRSQKFFTYLEKNEIDLDNFTDFIGCKEKLTLKKNPSKRGVLLSIDKREFLSKASGDLSGL